MGFSQAFLRRETVSSEIEIWDFCKNRGPDPLKLSNGLVRQRGDVKGDEEIGYRMCVYIYTHMNTIYI